LFLDYSHVKPNSFPRFKGLPYQGEEKLGKTEDDGIALTGKVELFPLGAFTKTVHSLKVIC
jgi:hypothetical protein